MAERAGRSGIRIAVENMSAAVSINSGGLSIPEGNNWIDARRTPRGNKTGQTRYHEENERYDGHRWNVVGPGAVEQGGHQSRRDCRQNHANGEPGKRQRQAALSEGKQNFTGRRP